MITRHLNEEQARTLKAVANLDGHILPLKLRGELFKPLSMLRREKLVVVDQLGAYRLTEAGWNAVRTGVFEKQPILMLPPIPAPKRGKPVHTPQNNQGARA